MLQNENSESATACSTESDREVQRRKQEEIRALTAAKAESMSKFRRMYEKQIDTQARDIVSHYRRSTRDELQNSKK
ncbi:hypothetical protein ECANGB1_825 [Enterospora canceri]|uniref:Uncharacterized protein n=1 Tax=Enterospora canceri TaxID=1081671 RepID=A0A1Y1S8I4_9MICR|nr:hypothetical protein ECANGB1_825 [Enterospora canceri]